MKKKIWLPIGILGVLAIIAFVVLPAVRGNAAGAQSPANFQTEPAKIGSVNASVGGTGAVRANQTASISWQTSGKVANVNVEKGQQVAADAVLAELLSTSLSQNVLQAQVDLVNAKEALDKAYNNSEAAADAHLALIQAQQAVEDAEQEAASMQYKRASQETIDIARANLITANDALKRAEDRWESAKDLNQESAAYANGLSQYASARQEQQQAQANLNYVTGLPGGLSVEEVNAELEQAKARLVTAEKNWDKVKNGPDADSILAAQVKVDIAQATLDLAHLTAPFAGTITQVDSQPGDLVTNGKTAFQIDDLSHLLVDMDISEIDINQVKIGQTVTLTFDAIPAEEFSGTVTDIALFGSAANGSVNFTVIVEIQNPSPAIKPGMTAAVNVVVSQLDNVLLVLSRAVRTLDNSRVVYVLKSNQVVPVEIELGSSANNYSQIISGDLNAGDLIILNPPTAGTDLTSGRGMGGTIFGGGGGGQ